MDRNKKVQPLRWSICLMAFACLGSYVPPAVAQSCSVGYEAPSGGGANAAPVKAKGKILCTNLTGVSGKHFVVTLHKEGVGQVATIDKYLNSLTYTEATVSVPCSDGRYFVSVVPSLGPVFGGGSVSSDWVSISCNAPPPVPTQNSVVTVFMGVNGMNAGYQAGVMGAVSPSTTSNGKIYTLIYDMYNFYTGPMGAALSLCGFAADPGRDWLVSVNVGQATHPSGYASYTYNQSGGGCASWSWASAFGLMDGSQVNITHRQ